MKHEILLVMLVIVLSIVVFFLLFDALHMSHVFRLETTPIAWFTSSDTRSEISLVYYMSDMSEYHLPQPELLDYLRELVTRDGITLALSGTEFGSDRNTVTLFILGDDFLLDPAIGESLSWSDPNETRFLAPGHPQTPIHMLSDNYRARDVILRPWNQLEEYFKTDNGQYTVLIYTAQNPERYLQDDKLFSFQDRANPDQAFAESLNNMLHVKKGDFYSSRSFWVIISMTSLLIVFVYFLLVSDHAKEIAVRKLSGQSVFRIFHELFTHFNLTLLMAWVGPMILLAIILGTGWNPLARSFYAQLLHAGLFFISGLLIASLVAIRYINHAGFSALKQSGKPTATSNAMYGVKFIFLILCIAFISTFWHNIQDYLSLKQHVDINASKPMYRIGLAFGAGKYGIDNEKVRQLTADYAMYFQNIQVLDIENTVIGETPRFLHLTVLAEHRLTDYADIILNDGSVFTPQPGKRYLLFPPGTDLETYFDIPGLNQSQEGVEFIEICADQNLVLPNEFSALYNNYKGYSFFLAEKIDSSLHRNYLIDRRVHPWSEVSQHLVDSGIPSWAVYPDYSTSGGQIETMQYHLQMNRQNTAIAGISLMIAVLIIYSFTRIYVDHHRKRLAVAYLLGESFVRRYGYLLAAWLIIYGALGLFFVLFRHVAAQLLLLNYSPFLLPRFDYDLPVILRLSLVFFALDGLLSLFFIHRLEIGVIRALKGGEI